MNGKNSPSDFVQYLTSSEVEGSQGYRVPTLNELSIQLGMSVARLREQMEVAKAFGMVEARPRSGIHRLPYTFLPAVRQSLSYAIELDQKNFRYFADLRNHVEAAYWYEAVSLLTPDDHAELHRLVTSAWEKLHGEQIQIPHAEHRRLHLAIYQRLANPFIQGLLEGYWEAYEAVGLNLYTDYEYLQEVWQYHQVMVEAICSGDLERGYQTLVKHKDLLYHRSARNGGEL